ncbi:MAG TPA: hypothetical protein PKC18_02680 [Lacipirellulaceae bacterium]|nr:hypothetical protein [Lacipirellulaceae bacterium]HMP05929.1 hypothetical protein [Lacipirellulaceae bacterium]
MKTLLLVVVAAAIAVAGGCSRGWRMDYGQPAAQFLAADIAAQGHGYLGQKVSVRGTVTRVDVGAPAPSWVYLDGGVRCNFGKLQAMAEQCQAGEVVTIDGLLRRCDGEDVWLEPALLRDPTAPFAPQAK